MDEIYEQMGTMEYGPKPLKLIEEALDYFGNLLQHEERFEDFNTVYSMRIQIVKFLARKEADRIKMFGEDKSE